MSESAVIANSDWAAQIATLRDLTATTSVLHEAQVLQLKNWPRVAAPNCKDYKVLVDQDGGVITVQYRFGVMSGPRKDFQEWVQKMAGWIHQLLGAHWLVNVHVNGKPRFTAGRQIGSPDGNRTHQARDPQPQPAPQR